MVYIRQRVTEKKARENKIFKSLKVNTKIKIKLLEKKTHQIQLQ